MTEYWLGTVERDRYGNAKDPVLHDGPHDSEQGVYKAKMLYDRIFKRNDERWVMIVVGEVLPYNELDDQENEDIDLCAEMIDRNRVRRGIPPSLEQEIAEAAYPGDQEFGSK